ncbi:hypothetical protein D3C86_1062970 [compost metagenome]
MAQHLVAGAAAVGLAGQPGGVGGLVDQHVEAVGHAERDVVVAQRLLAVARAQQHDVGAVVRDHVGAEHELAVGRAGGHRVAAERGDLGHGPGGRGRAADGDAVDVAAQVGGVGDGGDAQGVGDHRHFADHGAGGGEHLELRAGVGVEHVDPVALHAGAAGLGGAVGVDVFALVVAAAEDQQRAAAAAVAGGAQHLRRRPGLADAFEAGVAAGVVVLVGAALAPLQRGCGGRRDVEGVDQPAAAAHAGVEPGGAALTVGRDRAVHAVGLGRHRAQADGQAGEVDARGVVVQPLEAAVELGRHERPQLGACGGPADGRVAVAVDGAQHTVVAAVEHHHLGRGVGAVVDGHRARVHHVAVHRRAHGARGHRVALGVGPFVALVVQAARPVDELGALGGCGNAECGGGDGRVGVVEGGERGAAARRTGLHVAHRRHDAAQHVALRAFFHHVAVGAVRGFLLEAVAGRPEAPVGVGVAGGGCPEAARAGRDEAGLVVHRVLVVRVLQDQLAAAVQPELVLLEVAVPARKGVLVGAEHAHEHLVQVGALGVHAHGQAHRGEHAVDRLDLAEDVVQRLAERGAEFGLAREVVVLAVALLGHALQQRAPARALALGGLGGLDGVDLDAHAGLQETRPFVGRVVLRAAGAERDLGGAAAGGAQGLVGELVVVVVVLRCAVADVDDEGADAVLGARADIGAGVDAGQGVARERVDGLRCRGAAHVAGVVGLDLAVAGDGRGAGQVAVDLRHGLAGLAAVGLVGHLVQAADHGAVLELGAAVERAHRGAHVAAVAVRIALAGLGEHHQADLELVGLQAFEGAGERVELGGEGLVPVGRVVQHEQHVRGLGDGGVVAHEEIDVLRLHSLHRQREQHGGPQRGE